MKKKSIKNILTIALCIVLITASAISAIAINWSGLSAGSSGGSSSVDSKSSASYFITKGEINLNVVGARCSFVSSTGATKGDPYDVYFYSRSYWGQEIFDNTYGNDIYYFAGQKNKTEYSPLDKWDVKNSGNLIQMGRGYSSAPALAEALGSDVLQQFKTQDASVYMYATWKPNELTVNFFGNHAEKASGKSVQAYYENKNASDCSQDYTKIFNDSATSIRQTLREPITYKYDESWANGKDLPNSNNPEYLYAYRTGYKTTGYWYNDGAYSPGRLRQDTKFYNTQELAETFNVLSNLETGDVSINIYVEWVPIQYNVVFDGNRDYPYAAGTSDHRPSTDVHPLTTNTTIRATYDVYFDILSKAYTREGYELISWNTRPDGSGDTYDFNERVVNLTNIENATITLYAQWQPKIINVYLYPNGGEKSELSFARTGMMVDWNWINAENRWHAYYTFDSGYYAAIPGMNAAFMRNGYRQTRWAINSAESNQSYNTLSYNGPTDLHLYAIWEENETPPPEIPAPEEPTTTPGTPAPPPDEPTTTPGDEPTTVPGDEPTTTPGGETTTAPEEDTTVPTPPPPDTPSTPPNYNTKYLVIHQKGKLEGILEKQYRGKFRYKAGVVV